MFVGSRLIDEFVLIMLFGLFYRYVGFLGIVFVLSCIVFLVYIEIGFDVVVFIYWNVIMVFLLFVR